MDRISVNIQGETIECPSRTTLYELANKKKLQYLGLVFDQLCQILRKIRTGFRSLF